MLSSGILFFFLTSAMRHQNVCFYLISIINPFVERLLVSASGLSTEISSLSTETTHCSTKISGLSTKTTHCSMKITSLSMKISSLSMKIPSIGTIAWPQKIHGKNYMINYMVIICKRRLNM